MKKGKKLYEGKAKIIFASNDKKYVIQHFKDDATAFNNQKKAVMDGKGILNNRISEHILTQLNNVGIKNHLIKRLNMREQLVQHVEIIPIEFIVRNIATGSLTKRLGIEDGTVLDNPLIEYCLKDDDLGDPLVTTEHILTFKWMEKDELKLINKELNRILADEISPDTCRLWDVNSDKKLDKDRFRKGLGNLIEAYQEVARRLDILHEQSNIRPLKYTKPQAVKIKKK